MVFTNNRKRPLLKCGFAHRMRGRVRITCRAVRYLRQEQDDLEAHFSELRGVQSLRMNCAARWLQSVQSRWAENEQTVTKHISETYQKGGLSCLMSVFWGPAACCRCQTAF